MHRDASIDVAAQPTLTAPQPPADAPSLRSMRSLIQSGSVREALKVAEELRDHPGFFALDEARQAATHLAIVESRLARGDLVEAMTAGSSLAPFLGRPGATAALAYYGKAELAAALGDPQQAGDLYACIGQHLEADPLTAALIPWRVGASLAMLQARSRGAAALAAEHLDLVLDSDSAPAIALALRTVAACDCGVRRLALLRQARATLDGAVAERLGAQISTDLAEMLALSNDPGTRAESVALLRGAESYAGREELWPLRARVRRVLDRIGETATPLESETLAALTKTERRVAKLAAEGMSNRQIAELHEVGVKNVEWHLSRVYRKLEIRARGQLAPLFGALA